MSHDPNSHSNLYGRGIDAWCAGNLVEAEELLRSALATTPEAAPYLDDRLGALGGICAARGNTAEADRFLSLALEASLHSASHQLLPSVMVARYFLAEHYVTTGRPVEALEVLEPALGSGSKQEGLLRMLEALSAHALKDHERAASASVLALELAASSHQRDSIRERLQAVLTTGAA